MIRPGKDTFEQWNEEHALKHDLDKFYNHPNRIFRYIENKRIRILIEKAGIKSEHSVLEVGCGAGHILERINTGILTGTDISAVQIERAKKRLGNKAVLLKAKGEELPFPDNSFDRVICTEVFEHVLEPVLLLKEIKRVLKNNGIFSLSVPNEKLIIFTKKILLNLGLKRVLEPKESNWDLASKNNLDEWHLHEYGLKLIKEQVKEFFKLHSVSAIPFGFLPYRYVLKLTK